MAEDHIIKLFHGSNQAVEQPRLLKPTHPMDFGAELSAKEAINVQSNI